MSSNDPMLEIQTLLDGVEWNSNTLSRIASILIGAGYRVRDLNDVDLDPCPGCGAIEGTEAWGTVGDGFDGYCPSCADKREAGGAR